jgi:DNA-binding CsgD family transcriptional regulator/tetratricopeptide (TPR) repeat protein
MVEFTSANNLIATHESDGNLELARVVADRYAKRADELHLRTWMLQMRAMQCNAAMHLGAYDDVIAIVPQLLAGTPDVRTVDQLTVTLCLALTDLGRQQDALERLEHALEATAANDYYGRGSLLFARAEALLWRGDAEAALRDATEAVSLTPSGGHQLFPLLTLAHTQWRLGRPVVATVPEPHAPVLEAAPYEHAGYVALAGEQFGAAHEQFARAAELWSGRHRRGELRSRWLAAHTDPHDESGPVALLALESELDGLGWQPLLGQVRRSLRDRGVRRSAPRERSGALTAREREVLDLVGLGLSTEQIGSSLGLAPTTVAALIASARARVGAVNRWQAASDS